MGARGHDEVAGGRVDVAGVTGLHGRRVTGEDLVVRRVRW